MRCQARRGRRRGGVLSQAQIPGPLQRSPSGRGGGSDGGRSDARRLKPPIGRTCLRGTQTRRPRRREHPDGGAEKTAGMSAGPQMAMASSPGRGSRSDWCTIRREPPGTPARLKRHLTVMPQPDPRPVIHGTQVPRTVAALPERRMQRDKTSNEAPEGATLNYLDRLLLAPRPILGFHPRASMTSPGGSNPDRRRSLGFLTIRHRPKKGRAASLPGAARQTLP